jgi:hypothetical protein
MLALAPLLTSALLGEPVAVFQFCKLRLEIHVRKIIAGEKAGRFADHLVTGDGLR